MGVDFHGMNLGLFPADEVNMHGAAHIWNCKNCGKQYYNNRHRFNGEGEQYCSKACAYAHRKGVNHSKPAAKSMSPLLTLYYKSCLICGALSKHKLCGSLQCQKKRMALYSFQINSAKKVLKARSCIQCKKNFIPEYGNRRRVFCSKHCAKRWNVHQREGGTHKERAILFGVVYRPVNPIKVFERDKWHCQLCGISTPRRLKGKHQPQSPELDHIIPMSRGGGHTYENTQCACRKCNAIKLDKALGQLWIAGLAQPIKRNKIKGVRHQNLQKSALC
jgi:5-methylcytosine-specific restriction endonuclease McrA